MAMLFSFHMFYVTGNKSDSFPGNVGDERDRWQALARVK
jgi:hypothetical protein